MLSRMIRCNADIFRKVHTCGGRGNITMFHLGRRMRHLFSSTGVCGVRVPCARRRVRRTVLRAIHMGSLGKYCVHPVTFGKCKRLNMSPSGYPIGIIVTT